MRKLSIHPGSFVELTSGSFALVLNVIENDYGTFYNILLSDGTECAIDSYSAKPTPR